ncbi:Uu.00g134890.m01.CDS01 [Anthostomella pinea]|uniref:Uu.00g134890.m01.CDS01 n=1 Tax=Anthostomella pinea TaxID=933095 RepID=A0AAI8YKW1_9PEZI|nr:Uu.00g134890.m01.CDS01 [Anthostomella pinea]
MEEIDCVVVGAGWYGLAAAQQFHYTQPDSSLVILDAQPSLGGTWAEERHYPLLKSNNLLGTYEYPGFPMSSHKFDVKPGQHLKAAAINSYLKAYAEHSEIADLIRFNHKALSAEHQDTDAGGWVLTIAAKEGEKTIFARRLIIATGLTSNEFLPHFDGQEDFRGRVFHGKRFRQNSDTLKMAKAVTVFGATKSSWDAVYAYATAGVKVNWVVRASGHGPCWISSPYATPLKLRLEKLANTRLMTWFSPCIWGEADGYSWIRRFLHGTATGRFIVDKLWKTVTGDIMSQNDYDAHPDTAKLKPWTEMMFTGDSYSILNYDQDIFSLIKSNLVNVHVGEIDHLSTRRVHLADGTEFESDVLIANTGWKHVPSIDFLPKGIETELGIPHQPTESGSAPAQDLANQHVLVEAADGEIQQRFPRLRRQPVWNAHYKPITEQKGISSDTADEVTPYTPLTPYMLHRFMVPASARFLRTRDIAFAGMMSNFSNAITAHICGLWISAFFAGKLAIDAEIDTGASALEPPTDGNIGGSLRRLQYETMLFNRWGKWRYPTDWGTKRPSFTFDAVPYFDLLQRDLGLNQYRKGGWFAEMTQAYGPTDYEDITDEWMRKQKD